MVGKCLVDCTTARDINCGKTHMHSVKELVEAGLGEVLNELARQQEHLFQRLGGTLLTQSSFLIFSVFYVLYRSIYFLSHASPKINE